MTPLLFSENTLDSDAEPPIVGNLPWGTIVDVVVQNTINDTMPLYKHGDPMYLLGSKANDLWKWDTVEEAIALGMDELNIKTSPLQLVHDVPPMGWAVLRWQVRVRGATMMHSNKFKYYAVSEFYIDLPSPRHVSWPSLILYDCLLFRWEWPHHYLKERSLELPMMCQHM